MKLKQIGLRLLGGAFALWIVWSVIWLVTFLAEMMP